MSSLDRQRPAVTPVGKSFGLDRTHGRTLTPDERLDDEHEQIADGGGADDAGQPRTELECDKGNCDEERGLDRSSCTEDAAHPDLGL